MYVCHCEAITDRTIDAAIASGVRTVAEVTRGVEPAVDVVDATAPSRRSSMPLTHFASRQPAPPPERLSGLSVPSEAYDRGMTTTTTTTARSEESSDAR